MKNYLFVNWVLRIEIMLIFWLVVFFIYEMNVNFLFNCLIYVYYILIILLDLLYKVVNVYVEN